MTATAATKSGGDGRSVWRRLRHTPLSHLLWGRLSAALDWKHLIATCDLPKPVRGLIGDVVKRTRLWRREKAEVATELIAHFRDALEADETAEQAVDAFGEPRSIAKLIRRGKRKCRPLGWQIRHRIRQGLAVFVVGYLLAGLWLATGKPEPSVDYLAILNAPLEGVPEEDKAWPILREAMIEHETWRDEFADGIYRPEPGVERREYERVWFYSEDAAELPGMVEPYADFLAAVREAASKPVMGEGWAFERDRDPLDLLALYGPGHEPDDGEMSGADDDPSLAALWRESLIGVLLPSMSRHRQMTRLLSADAHAAVVEGDGARFVENVEASLGLARLIAQGHILIEDLIAVSLSAIVLQDVAWVIERRPELLDDAQLRRLAHLLAASDAGMDVDFSGERMLGLDTFQRVYDPDTGRITPDGIRFVTSVSATHSVPSHPAHRMMQGVMAPLAMPVAAMGSATYDELIAEYDRLYDMIEATPRRLYPPDSGSSLDAELERKAQDFWWRVRYMPLMLLMPALDAAARTEIQTRAWRDAVAVAIAAEAYRRRHGAWPANTAALVPDYLPESPTDLTDVGPTGAPRSAMKLAVVDGGLRVYGLGWDGDDDGGAWASPTEHGTIVQVRPPEAERGGDWVLFPMAPEAE
ncbi:MAG: hypothetical protein AAF078_02505 [Planctomycetota bacterium]